MECLGHPLVFATMLLGSNHEPYGKAQYSFLLMYQQETVWSCDPVPITISPMPGQWGLHMGSRFALAGMGTGHHQVYEGCTVQIVHSFPHGRLAWGKCFCDHLRFLN